MKKSKRRSTKKQRIIHSQNKRILVIDKSKLSEDENNRFSTMLAEQLMERIFGENWHDGQECREKNRSSLD